MPSKTIIAAVAVLALVLAPMSAGMKGKAAQATGTLSLGAVLTVGGASDSRRFGESCAPGTPALVECFDVVGSGTIRGLGRVSLTSLQFVDTAPAGCDTGSFRVLGSSVRLSIGGKGTIEIAVGEATGCRTLETVLSHTRSYSITGGTGAYSNSTGAGTVRRNARFTSRGSTGSETWEGTLSVAGLEFDLAPPTLTRASKNTVRAPRGAASVRVRYSVKAADDRDGAVPVTCTPKPGTRFRIGRTRVACTATDTSGNAGTGTFWVTVRRSG